MNQRCRKYFSAFKAPIFITITFTLMILHNVTSPVISKPHELPIYQSTQRDISSKLLWNVPIVRFVGGSGNEKSSISHVVEAAFETYRKSLITLVEGIDKILEKIDQLDGKSQYRYASVHSRMKNLASRLPILWEQNECVLRESIRPWDMEFLYLIMPADDDPNKKNCCLNASASGNNEDSTKKDVASYNSIVQLLVHLNRDWTAFGANVRKRLYHDGILPVLKRYVPILIDEEKMKCNAPRILIPGAGLGRLILEVAALGYDVEGNECSGTMLALIDTLFNHLLPDGEVRHVYPFLHNPLQDDWNLESRAVQAVFPYIEDSPSLQEIFCKDQCCNGAGRLARPITIQHGDFVGIYGRSRQERKDLYESVITCFFIDTNDDVIEYIDTIFHILRPGGVWINLGPLHYHSRQAVPYSFNHLIEIIELSGFHILEDTTTVEAAYCGEDFYSMKPEVYRVPLTAFRKVVFDKTSNDVSMVSGEDILGSNDFNRTNYRIIK